MEQPDKRGGRGVTGGLPLLVEVPRSQVVLGNEGKRLVSVLIERHPI